MKVLLRLILTLFCLIVPGIENCLADNVEETTLVLDEFLVNHAGPSCSVILAVLALHLKDEKTRKEIFDSMARVRDIIIITMSSKKIYQYSEKNNRPKVLLDIKDALNSYLKNEGVQKVDFRKLLYN